jgi:hypothetical protein
MGLNQLRVDWSCLPTLRTPVPLRSLEVLRRQAGGVLLDMGIQDATGYVQQTFASPANTRCSPFPILGRQPTEERVCKVNPIDLSSIIFKIGLRLDLLETQKHCTGRTYLLIKEIVSRRGSVTVGTETGRRRSAWTRLSALGACFGRYRSRRVSQFLWHCHLPILRQSTVSDT